MKVASIVAELQALEQKRDEISNVLNESAYGEAYTILSRELANYAKKIDTFLNSEFEPKATLVYISATADKVDLNVGDSVQLNVKATLSDGNVIDITAPSRTMMLFNDFDKLFNNVGFITSVDVSEYVGDDITLEIVKTANGFDVDDNLDTQGLGVVHTDNENEYRIVDVDNNPIGVTFTTNGQEVTGDNWLIDVYKVDTGTTYLSTAPNIATVDAHGVVTAISAGTCEIIVTNGELKSSVSLTVTGGETGNEPGQGNSDEEQNIIYPPTITSVTPIEEGIIVEFVPSISDEVVSYNLYLSGTLYIANIEGNSPITVTGLDSSVTYTVGMTAVDVNGNESELSNTVDIMPLEPPTGG